MSNGLSLRSETLLGTRAVSTRPTSWRASDLSVEAVAATESPVRTSYWDRETWERVELDEVLDVTGLSAADIEAFVGCPVLDSHSTWSTGDIVGVVDEARVEGTELIVRMRISPTEPEIAAKVESGVIRKVSIGYARRNGAVTTEREGNVALRRQPFEPLEISLVAVPADRNATIRSAQTVRALGPDADQPTSQDPDMNVEAIRSAAAGLSTAVAALQTALGATTPAGPTAAELEARATADELARRAIEAGNPASPSNPVVTIAASVAGARSADELAIIQGWRAVATDKGKGAEFEAFVAGGSSVSALRSMVEGYVSTPGVRIDGTATQPLEQPSNGARATGFIDHHEATTGVRSGGNDLSVLTAALTAALKR